MIDRHLNDKSWTFKTSCWKSRIFTTFKRIDVSIRDTVSFLGLKKMKSTFEEER